MPAIRTRLLTAAAATLLALPAFAQTAPQEGGDHGGDHAATAVPSSANQAYEQAMAKMHAAMTIAPTGDADVDFVRGMIPHHQGAIDMARIQLEFGQNPELHAMSEQIIAAQEDEIARMQQWLEAHAPDAANADAAKMESLTANPATGAAPEQ